MYGCEVLGVSDTALQTTRSTVVAAAAAPEAGGKNPDINLLVLDGPAGTLDPAFHAHLAPLKHWALAWWEGWFSKKQMEHAFTEASLKLGNAKGTWWGRVTGPTGALLATSHRLGWQMPSACEVIDDLGLTCCNSHCWEGSS